ncbi:hypothetical protein BKH41_09120 [Helicobacter sp. 12S02232-10]|uniref:hypothetical protein n=1 Tax=Helicobacter sp. 12S02232-10 TaxID=1476197 RepID=UPI000BD43152|nr:hypothetical protein [Helicobacter sp. 12S02232-10]PAF46463.1 hypothetical protein BKH41_09120 [Helicobacter sp. 12S02232-10]
MDKKEQTGIYNVTFNEKKATPIQTDVELIENAIIESVVMYIKGYHNPERDRGLGAEHIKLHLDPESKGYIAIEELLNLGKSIREYTKLFKKPFIDKRGAKVYEWENQENVRFRVIVDKQRGGPQLPLSPSDNQIISFYSDRNLNEAMQFKNPLVTKHYTDIKNNKSLDSQLQKIEKTLSSKSSIDQKQKALDELERFSKKVLNQDQKEIVPRLKTQYADKSMNRGLSL